MKSASLLTDNAMKRLLAITLSLVALFATFSCQKENNTNSNNEDLSTLAGTRWSYTKIDTLNAPDGSAEAQLIDKMTFNFTSESKGTYSMDFELLVEGETDYADVESYPMDYTYNTQNRQGNIIVKDEGGNSLYNFTFQITTPSTMDVRIGGSNPMEFTRQ